MSVELNTLWRDIYREVAGEMKMPDRGKRGSPQNKERQRLAPMVFQETRRRYDRALDVRNERARSEQ